MVPERIGSAKKTEKRIFFSIIGENREVDKSSSSEILRIISNPPIPKGLRKHRLELTSGQLQKLVDKL